MNHTQVGELPARLEAQPRDVLGLPREERDALIVSAREIDGQWIVLNRYGDDRWQFSGQPTNKQPSEQTLDFGSVPAPLRASMKAILYRYVRRGREGTKRPSPRAIVKLLNDARPFL